MGITHTHTAGWADQHPPNQINRWGGLMDDRGLCVKGQPNGQLPQRDLSPRQPSVFSSSFYCVSEQPPHVRAGPKPPPPPPPPLMMMDGDLQLPHFKRACRAPWRKRQGCPGLPGTDQNQPGSISSRYPPHGWAKSTDSLSKKFSTSLYLGVKSS